MRLRTLVVDDVELARERIARLLGAHDDVEIVGEAADGAAAAAAVEALQPDLVILDIAMPGTDGMALARSLKSPGAPAVIFVTAHGDHALSAFDAAAVDYLLKPVSPERLAEALDRVRGRMRAHPKAEDTLLVPDGARTHRVALEHIDHVHAEGHYLAVHANGESYLLREPLSSFAARLGADFARVHRSAIVRIDRIAALRERRNGDAMLTLTTGASVPVSRTHRAALARRLAARSI